MAPARSDAPLAQPAHLEGDARGVADDLLSLLALVPGWVAPGAAGVARAEVAVHQLGGAMSNHIFRVEARALAPCAPAAFCGVRFARL
jgi:hypothetical protein